MLSLKLEGIPPSKKNEIVRCTIKSKSGKLHHFVAPTQKYRKWESAAALDLRSQASQVGRFGPLKTPVIVSICFLCKCKRSWDLSNKAESVMDALVAGGVLEDDNRFCVPTLVYSCKESPSEGVAIAIVESHAAVVSIVPRGAMLTDEGLDWRLQDGN